MMKHRRGRFLWRNALFLDSRKRKGSDRGGDYENIYKGRYYTDRGRGGY